jgi:hypothetical protein
MTSTDSVYGLRCTTLEACLVARPPNVFMSCVGTTIVCIFFVGEKTTTIFLLAPQNTPQAPQGSDIQGFCWDGGVFNVVSGWVM